MIFSKEAEKHTRFDENSEKSRIFRRILKRTWAKATAEESRMSRKWRSIFPGIFENIQKAGNTGMWRELEKVSKKSNGHSSLAVWFTSGHHSSSDGKFGSTIHAAPLGDCIVGRNFNSQINKTEKKKN